MADEPEEFPRGERTRWMNVLVYHLLISIVNVLNLPLEKGTFVPRRAFRLTVMKNQVDHFRLLKRELDPTDPGSVRAFLLPVKALFFEIRFLLEQDPTLRPNPDFLPDLERLETLLYNVQDVSDFGDVADLAYRLSILLPYYEDPSALEMRRAQAAEFDRLRPRR